MNSKDQNSPQMSLPDSQPTKEVECTLCGTCPQCKHDVLRRPAPENGMVRWYVSSKGYNHGCGGSEALHECWGCGYQAGPAT